MLQKFFFNLYTAFIGLFYNGKPRLVDLAFYRESIFNPVGLWTLVMAAGFALIFYFVFNGRLFPFLNGQNLAKPRHWWATCLLVAGVGAWLAYFIGIRLGAAPEPYLRYFIVVNTLLASVWFFLLSWAMKRGSQNASTAPFAGL